MKKFILLLILAATAAAQEQVELQGVLLSPLHQAQEYEAKQQWGELEAMAQGWTETDGANWESWYYYGYAQLKLGKAEQAVKALSVALKLSVRSNDKLLLLLADSYKAIGNYQDAEISYRRLLERYPNNEMLWDSLRDVLEHYLLLETVANRAEVEQALMEVLKKLLTFAGFINNYDLWQRYVILLDVHDGGEETRRGHVNLLRLKPDNLPAVEWMFRYDVEHGDAERLAKTIKHLETLDKNNPLLHLHYAELALAEKNERRATEHYEVVVKSEGKVEQYRDVLAQAFSGLGDLLPISGSSDEALDYYKRAVHTDPAYLHAWEQIVIILRGRKKYDEARRYFSLLRRIKNILDKGKPLPADILAELEEERS